ncbi:methionyl-tRNA formyltransferase [Thiomicrorhabdus aquaedulcis]|uniref:methionyl-tRNA formyltransferase n=1 Tax=Thiomicrorhabdus aquaedulcis TaxID=2211106 RepID=UPI000FD8AF68|nr:methionyl-tRNA formyltransferase [Thiomicrorhabdus aquaedulcis]
MPTNTPAPLPAQPNTPLNIIFAGTPEFSVGILQALLDSPHNVIAVYTQPDRPAGRGRKLAASPVKALALTHHLPVFQPETLRDVPAQEHLAQLNADVMVVVAYGLILPKAVLIAPKYGCLNIHASLLPRWRGAAPIQRAIEAGDSHTGITIMQMDIGLDTGDMLYKIETPIADNDTAQTLHDRLSGLGAEALLHTLHDVQTQTLLPQIQDEHLATYADKLNKAQARINWSESAEVIVRKIHAFNPYPIAFCHYQEQPLRIWSAKVHVANVANVTNVDDVTDADMNAQTELKTNSEPNVPGLVIAVNKQGIVVATGTQPILIEQVQPAGKNAMAAYDFAQARALTGTVLE